MGNLIRLILTIGTFWLLGLIIFIAHVPTESGGRKALADTPPDIVARTGVVVYTGGRGLRIAKAMELFRADVGKRLLISGVNPETTRAQLRTLWTGETTRFDCCVDLGLEAESTKGNARELADWSRQHELDTIILVTSDYHMPRALAETRAIANNINIVAYVAPSSYIRPGGLPRTADAWKALSVEYSKFLMVRITILTNQLWRS